MPCCAAQSRATCWLEITVLFHVVDCAIRNSKAPASRSSCKASLPQVVVLLLGGPGEKPIGNTFRPLMTQVLFDFYPPSGLGPEGTLLYGGSGILYGTTVGGGSSAYGTVFALELP